MKNDNERVEPIELHRNTPIPLYYQIAQYIRRQIDSGEVKPGEQILTEEKLQQKFGVSRATIRRAISELVYEGLLERRRSKGTTVSRPMLEGTLQELCSFTNEVLKQNRNLTSKILQFRTFRAPGKIAEYLQVSPGESLVFMTRLRFVDGEPVCVEDWYAPARYFPGLNRSYFKEEGIEQSTYYVIQKHFGFRLHRAVDTMSAVALEQEDAKLLNMEKGMPALLRTRVTYTVEGIPLTYVIGRYIIKLVVRFVTG